MKSFKAFLVFGFLSALIDSVTLLETTPQAYAQQCPNGVCP
jgi:hypothetical protein